MLLTALRRGRRLKGLKHSFTRRSPKWRKREEDREGESSQGQSGETAVIWVILVRNENGSLSPITLLMGEEKKMGRSNRAYTV